MTNNDKDTINIQALTGMILGIAGLLTLAISVGYVLGIIGLVISSKGYNISKSTGVGENQAVIGLVLGCVVAWFLLLALLSILY